MGEENVVAPSPAKSGPDPEPTEPSASPPPPRVPMWLILDRIVHRSTRQRGVVEGDATASALAHDCVGRPVRASLRIADPPAVSRLYLHWTASPASDRFRAVAIAAHRNSILFRMTIPFDASWSPSASAYFPDDYFVYSSSAPPSLTPLPPCFLGGGDPDPKLDQFMRPYRNQQQRTMIDKWMGILCHGDNGDDFTVAQLTCHSNTEVELCLLHHVHHGDGRPPSTDVSMEWSVRNLQIPPDVKINLQYSWGPDVVLPVGDRCLCWADLYNGMVLVDVLANGDSESSSDQQLLHYISLPSKALNCRRFYYDEGIPDPLRCVCVTDAGVIKLVCIFVKDPPSPYPFTIRTWILDDIRQGIWRMDVKATMGAGEFFGLLDAAQQSCLPRVRPSFPMVSLVNPDVICFQLDDEDRGLYWMIEVNTSNKILRSSALYINKEEEERGYPSKRGRRYELYDRQFIPSKFSS